MDFEGAHKDYGESRIVCFDSWKVALFQWATRSTASINIQSARGRAMAAKRGASRRTSKPDLARVDARVVQPSKYRDLPGLLAEILARAKARMADCLSRVP